MGRDAETEEAARELLRSIRRAHYISRFSTPALFHVCEALPADIFSRLAEEVVDIIHNLLQDEGNRDVPSRSASLRLAQGMVALYQGHKDQALRHFRHAAEQWLTLERPHDQVRALQMLGRTLVMADRPGEAQRTYAKAVPLVERLASQLADAETKHAYLQSPLVQAVQRGARNQPT
jgi:hypothetical protein